MVLGHLVLTSPVLGRCDEVPDEGADLVVALVRVDAVKEGQPDSVLNILGGEAFADSSRRQDLVPRAPAERERNTILYFTA